MDSDRKAHVTINARSLNNRSMHAMRVWHHDIHRQTVKQMTERQYNMFVGGILFAPLLAGLFGAILTHWPLILVAYIALVIYATWREIEATRHSVLGRLTMWPQYATLFVSAFIGANALLQGRCNYFAYVILLVPPILFELFNRRRIYRAFYFQVARSYLLEVRDVRKQTY